MMELLSVVNYATVFIYGLFLTAAFTNTLKDKKNLTGLIIFYLFIFAVQATIFFIYGKEIVEKTYPLVTHLPLILFLVFYCKKTFSTAVIAVVCAYLFTAPRHWLGSLVSVMFNNSIPVLLLTKILVTIPLLFLINRYVVPTVRAILKEGGKGPWFFSALLIYYYFFSYATTVYSNLLYSGNTAVIESIASAFVITYFVFNVLYFREAQRRTKAENETKILELKAQQAQVYFDQIKQSKEQIALYRHDLRHHLQSINAYLESGDVPVAQNYIKSICDGVDATIIVDYCENETVNLLLSYYVEKAKNAGIDCVVKAIVPNDISVPSIDLCVIIANAMENATNACLAIPNTKQPIITVNAYTKKERLFLEITNPYYGEIKMENEIPVTDTVGHGVGTKSIVMTAEKYGGIWSFEAKDGKFFMHVVL